MATVDFAERIDSTLDNIDNSDEIHPDNKALIREFNRDLKLEDLSEGWRQKLTTNLKVIAEHCGDLRFEDMDTNDVKDLVEWLHDRDLADETVRGYKQVIKRFWRWLHNLPRGEHPEMTDWINTTPSNGTNGTLPTDLLTRDDVDALKDGTRNARDRAFIAVLYETGARIGELIDLTVGDIEDHTQGKKVVIDGKTGQRRLRLLESAPPLNKWLNEHPTGEDDDPLWCHLREPEPLSYHYIRQKLLERAKERAGVDKPVNPHHFRHSRATELAQKFKEAQLKEWFGWTQGSSVPAKYVHLSGRDIDDAYGKLHGIVPEDEQEDEETVIECWRCEELNERDDKFCSRCGAALDEDTANLVAVAEQKTTESAEESDLELALDLARAIGNDREAVQSFIEEHRKAIAE